VPPTLLGPQLQTHDPLPFALLVILNMERSMDVFLLQDLLWVHIAIHQQPLPQAMIHEIAPELLH
jgi:hypothetical protein